MVFGEEAEDGAKWDCDQHQALGPAGIAPTFVLFCFLFFLKQPQGKDWRASSLSGRQYQKHCEGAKQWDRESREISTGCVGDAWITTVDKYGSDL